MAEPTPRPADCGVCTEVSSGSGWVRATRKNCPVHGYAEQPMPVPSDRPSVQSLVRADLELREQVGVARYGTPLQAHNGRDALRDAYEEALDLACYLRQAIEERDQPRTTTPSSTAEEATS